MAVKKAMVRICAVVVAAALAGTALAFDWPQQDAAADSFFSYFGQRRGKTIAPSLIFNAGGEASAAGGGGVTAVILEHSGDFGWFESTLGNAVVLSHDGDLSTVYANLDDGSVPQELLLGGDVQAGDYLGTSGNSGWQQGQSSLEFMVLDTKNRTVINPRVLMPRVGKELELSMGAISAELKGSGQQVSFAGARTIPSGTYRIYRERQDIAVPYRSMVAINGAAVETIQYDVLRENDGRLCAYGNRPYSADEVYPDDRRQLLGEAFLSPGRNIVTITIFDITGLPEGSKTVSYTVDVR